VDASVGGKTGVDLGALKNQIGVIISGEMVLIDTQFLDTLPQNHLKSGFAEMLKHGLIYDRNYWDKLTDLSKLTLNDLDALIYESVEIKKAIVTQDPHENGLRKTLNFGHRSEEHTSELQSRENLVCRLLLENKNDNTIHMKREWRPQV